MSREVYGSLNQTPRSPKPGRHTDVPPHQSAKYYNTSSISQPVSSHGSPIASRTASSDTRRGRSTYSVSRSGNVSPTLLADQHVPHSISTSAFNVGNHSAYYDDLGSPTMDGRSGPSAGSGHHRSRSATRVPLRNYHSLERDQEREFMPIREPRDRSLDRNDMASRHPRSRERSLDRSGYRDREVGHVGYRDIDGQMEGAHMSRMAHGSYTDTRHGCGRTSDGYGRSGGDGFVMELQSRLNELQAQYSNMKRELDITTEKLGSSMHSIKTFWSPELKKERALRKEEAAKYALLNDQLKMLRAENQKQSALIRQMEEELRLSHMRNPDAEVQQHLEALYNEKEHMTKEIYFLRETIKELEMRIETQKQTLGARDESLKKLLEMKGVGGKIMEEERIEFERMKGKIIETESRCRQFEAMLDAREKELNKMEELRIELNRRDQEIMAMGAKMKTLEEQHHDYQRHIAVLKESLCAKEEHYNMLQADVEELRVRLEEKNKLIEKKTQQTMSSTQDRNRLTQEVQELRDHMEIKDRKINVLQRKMQPGPQDVSQQAEIISLRKDNEEKQKKLDDSEKKLKKCQEKLKQLESQPQQPSSTPNEVEKLRERCKKVEEDKEKTVKELQKAQEDSSRLQAELERLLEIMTSVEKEKFALNEQIRELQDSARDRDAKLQGAKRGQQSDRTKNAQMLEEARRRESEASKEAAKAQEQVLQQLDRIEELEEAVRKSVDITAQREVAIAQSEEVIKVAEERISNLQSEVKALQKVHNARCTNCPLTKIKMSRMEDELKRLLSERKSYLEELFEMKQEALSAAISEKDSHLAVLEMSGIKNAKTAEQVDTLKAERKRLVERIKTENENRVKLLLELSALSHESNGKNENVSEEEGQHNAMESKVTPHL